MADVLNLVFPFFVTPRSYAQMLQKLAGAAFYEVYIITFFLRDIEPVGSLFSQLESYGRLGAAIRAIPHSDVVNVSGFVLALLVALFSHVVQLHDRISDLLGIRKRFDRKQILLPLAKLVRAELTPAQVKAIKSKRDSLMRDVFYRYASSRADAPLVDKHDIEQALGAWSWFWLLLEGSAFFAGGGIIAHAFHTHVLGVRLLVVAGILACLALAQSFRLGRYARVEIEAIAADHTASNDVRAKFNAL